MNKQKIVACIMSVCMMAVFCFPAFADTTGNTVEASYSVVEDDVSYYVTATTGSAEVRSVDYAPRADGQNGYVRTVVIDVYVHVSMTIRNRDPENYKIMDTNNIRLDLTCGRMSNPSGTGGANQNAVYENPKLVANSKNVDVWRLTTFNGANAAYVGVRSQLRYTGNPYLGPEEQIYMEYDIMWSNWRTELTTSTSHSVDGILTGFMNQVLTTGSIVAIQLPTYTTVDTETFMQSNQSGILGKIWQAIIGNNPTYDAVEPDAEEVDEAAQDLHEEIDDVHAQEAIWYQQNQDAIEATGLRNWHYHPRQADGIFYAVGQFTAVWTALGQWTLLYTFVLSLSLAVFLLRHRPFTKLAQANERRQRNEDK